MNLSTIIPHIEALIFASEKPLTTLEIVDLVNNALGFIEDRASLDQVESAIDGIREKYAAEFYAFEMRESGGGWQFLTKKEYHKTVALINGEKFLKRLSVAALETLAIIAYKQPITKSEIENIRGVNCDYAVQKLLEKELVIIAGRNENAVGKPLIYTTSKSFMDYFGINSPEDLPKIREVLMEELVEATRLQELNQQQGLPAENEEDIETTNLLVNEQGEIVDHESLTDVEPLTENESHELGDVHQEVSDNNSSENETELPSEKTDDSVYDEDGEISAIETLADKDEDRSENRFQTDEQDERGDDTNNTENENPGGFTNRKEKDDQE